MPPIETQSMRNACSEAIYEVGRENPKVIAMSADQDKTFQLFKNNIRERYIDPGIAEANMTGIAAGLAHCGKIPYTTSIAGILTMRACEQIRVDVCYNKLPVRIVGHGAGISYGTLGTTHHAIEDLAMMRSIPNMTVIIPADAIETKRAIKASVDYPGPIYIRIGTGEDPVVYEADYNFTFQIGKPIVLKDGDDVQIFAVGSCLAYALLAADDLEKEGIKTGVTNVHTIKPLDGDFLLNQANRAKVLVSVEEHNYLGGLGSALAELFMGKVFRPMKILGIPDLFSDVADRKDLYETYGLDTVGIARAARELLNKQIGL
jgi:transketolase